MEKDKDKKQKLSKENKIKEVAKGRLSKRMIVVKWGDLLEEKVEVIVNSIGSDPKYGFGGMIGKCIVKECGEGIIDEAIQETQNIFGGAEITIGNFVSTSAGKSKNHRFVLHAVAPNYTDDNSKKTLANLIKKILTFCHENKVESISMPPIGSGVLGFPADAWAQAFFDGCMDFLEENSVATWIRKWNIAVFEQEKAEKFQDEWDECFAKKYKGNLDSEVEESGEEAPDTDEEDDDPAPKKSSNKKKILM